LQRNLLPTAIKDTSEYQLELLADAWTNNVLFPEIEKYRSGIEVGSLDFDELFQAEGFGNCASKTNVVKQQHLTKLWSIDHEIAKQRIEVMSQLATKAPSSA
jgi:hypothetical protein